MTYNPAFDGLRAIAITMVLLFHLTHYVEGGFIGVDIFFVLSGYLITSILRNELTATGSISFRNFYARRCVRLLPALAVLVLVFIVVNLGISNRGDVFSAAAAATFYVMNFASAYNYIGAGDPGYAIAHTWSLATEEQFYLIWPAIFLLAYRYMSLRGCAYVALGLAITSALLRATLAYNHVAAPILYYSPETHCDGIFLGCFIALYATAGHAQIARATWILPALGIMLLAAIARWDATWMEIVGFPIVDLCAAWIVLALVSGSTILSRSLSLRIPVYIGTISYGIYLWHSFIIHNTPDDFPRRVLVFGLYPAAVGLATLSYFCVERPLQRAFRARLGRPTRATVTATYHLQ